MLTCNACTSKTIRIVLADLVEINPVLKRHLRCRLVAGSSQSWPRRTLASSAKPVVPTSTSAPTPNPMDPMPLSTKKGRQTIAAPAIFDKRSLTKELVYLKDPLKLADYIDALLRQDQFDKAFELTRNAGKDMACTVSWNHLINYNMHKGRTNAAVKLYNEVESCTFMARKASSADDAT